MKTNKKIVHINFSFTVGGTENLLIDLLNNQAPVFSVYLIIVNKHYSETLLQQLHPKVKVIRINRIPASRDYLKIVRLNMLITGINPHIIHCHNPNIIKVLFTQRYKTILTVHDVNIETENLQKFGTLVAISKAVKDDVMAKNKKCQEVNIVHNGIDFNRIPVKTTRTSDNSFKILQVSRLIHEKKGQDILLKAIRQLVNKHGKSIELYLIGSGKSRNHLENLIQEYQLQNLVFILADKDRSWIYPNLKNFDILVQPSRYEGFGLTVVEGMAARLPVIASDLDGPREILANGRFGYLFESGDVDGLTKNILNVMEQYTNGTIESQVDMAYQHGVKNFSLNNMLKGYGDVYQHLHSWRTEKKIAVL